MSARELGEKLKKILTDLGVYGEVHSELEKLTGIASEVINQQNMDSDTIIYRMAMMVYHSESLTGRSLFNSVHDPGQVYLRLGNNKTIKSLVDEPKRSYSLKIENLKTVLSFIIGAYIYYTAIGESENAATTNS